MRARLVWARLTAGEWVMIELAFALALMAQEPASTPPPAPPASGPTSPVTPPTPAPAAPEAAKAGDEMVCKRVDTATGSRLGRGKRVCRPASEWEEAADSAQRATNDSRRAFRPDIVDQ